MNVGFGMGINLPLVHTLNKTNCVNKMLVQSLICMLLFIKYIQLQRYVTIGFYSSLQQKLPVTAVPELISWRSRIILVPAKNVKVIARYCISRTNRTIKINRFSVVLAMHPHLKIGDTVILMLYEGTGGIFLFIDEMPSRRDQATSSGQLWLLALSFLKCATCYYLKYVDMDHMVVKIVHFIVSPFVKQCHHYMLLKCYFSGS